MSRDQREMMEAEDKLEGQSANPLTKLFRRLLAVRRIKYSAWDARLTMFLKSHYSRAAKNAKDIGQERNNFNRAVSRPAMTWKTFQKAIQVLGPLEYKLSISMKHRNGTVTTVDTGFIKNPLADLDNLANVKTASELDPEFLNGEYDEDEDSDDRD